MRLPAAILVLCLFFASTGSAKRSGAGDGWGPDKSKKLAKMAYSAKTAGNLAEAETLFDEGRSWCLRNGYPGPALRFTIAGASIRFARGSFRGAAATYLDAEREAERLGDVEALVAIRGNLASLYFLFQDRESAIRIAERALRDLPQTSSSNSGPNLLLALAAMYSESGRPRDAASLYERALSMTIALQMNDLEIIAWDQYGTDRLRAGDLDAAEHHLLQAFRLRRFLSPNELAVSYEHLGELYLRRGNLAEALLFANRALESNPVRRVPSHSFFHLRGRVRAALNDKAGALEDFDSALRLAEAWRGEVLPADALRSGSNAAIQNICDSFVDTAEDLYVETGREEYARAAWEALEENRAVSLREMIANPWRERINPAYWKTLESFRTSLMSAIRDPDDGPAIQRARDLQIELTRMEAEAGLGGTLPLRGNNPNHSAIFPQILENIPSRVSLPLLRDKLGQRAFISFRLGEEISYRWVVTAREFTVDRLPGRATLEVEVERFQKAVRDGDADAIEYGSTLCKALFGGLPRSARRATDWLLAPDESLYSVPFSALVVERRGSKAVFLAERHATELVPGAWAIGDAREHSGTFAALADPIYNRADPRLDRMNLQPSASRTSSTVEFARLPATAAEAQACSREYGASQNSILLGRDASREGLRRVLNTNAAVVHIATHVLADKKRQEPLIILSSSTVPGQVDVLTVRDVASMNVPGSLIVMSGCSSAAGRVIAGAGLLGLSRAWLSAGARGVIASHWPVPDDDSALFGAFYHHLGRNEPANTAEALQRARIELIRAGGRAASPRYWAAYEYIGRSD